MSRQTNSSVRSPKLDVRLCELFVLHSSGLSSSLLAGAGSGAHYGASAGSYYNSTAYGLGHAILGYTRDGNAVLEDFSVDGLYLVLRVGDAVYRTPCLFEGGKEGTELEDTAEGVNSSSATKGNTKSGLKEENKEEDTEEVSAANVEEDFVLPEENIRLGDWNERFGLDLDEIFTNTKTKQQIKTKACSRSFKKKLEEKRRKRARSEAGNSSRNSILNTPVLDPVLSSPSSLAVLPSISDDIFPTSAPVLHSGNSGMRLSTGGGPTNHGNMENNNTTNTSNALLTTLNQLMNLTMEIELWRSTKQGENLIGKQTLNILSELFTFQQQQQQHHIGRYGNAPPAMQRPGSSLFPPKQAVLTKVVPLQMASSHEMRLGLRVRLQNFGLMERFESIWLSQMLLANTVGSTEGNLNSNNSNNNTNTTAIGNNNNNNIGDQTNIMGQNFNNISPSPNPYATLMSPSNFNPNMNAVGTMQAGGPNLFANMNYNHTDTSRLTDMWMRSNLSASPAVLGGDMRLNPNTTMASNNGSYPGMNPNLANHPLMMMMLNQSQNQMGILGNANHTAGNGNPNSGPGLNAGMFGDTMAPPPVPPPYPGSQGSILGDGAMGQGILQDPNRFQSYGRSNHI